jgi:phosphopantothenoylcysteine decarboxylase/phosphopantothenate--cysteine ligase
VANDVSRSDAGFETDENAVTLIDDHGETPVALAPKPAVAGAILDHVQRMRAAAASPSAQEA